MGHMWLHSVALLRWPVAEARLAMGKPRCPAAEAQLAGRKLRQLVAEPPRAEGEPPWRVIGILRQAAGRMSRRAMAVPGSACMALPPGGTLLLRGGPGGCVLFGWRIACRCCLRLRMVPWWALRMLGGGGLPAGCWRRQWNGWVCCLRS
jgi:hypothetical protein